MKSFRTLAFMALVSLTMAPAAAYAQASITGVVKDTSGAVLPGVTVEAESPALIERVRSAVTDGTGRYRIEELRPGAYTVTFSLPGFATVKREGVELSGSFVATINADLRVGGLEETITVTGETPVVDVQSVTRQRVVDDEILRALPTGRVPGLVLAAMPNITQNELNVGGIQGELGSGSTTTRGVADVQISVGNVTLKTAGGSSGPLTVASNIGAYQELAVDTGGLGVDRMEGGVRLNLIPREGGNTFHGFVQGAFANHSMQANNFTPELKASGLRAPDTVKKFWEINPGLGGPILRDKLWFHWTMRASDTSQNISMFYNKNAGDPTKWTYEPDTSREPYFSGQETRNWSTVRLTWQASAKNKIGFTYDDTEYCDCPSSASATRSPEATEYVFSDPRSRWIADWTAPVTNRLLLQATVNKFWTLNARPRQNLFFPPGPIPLIQVQEQSTGLTYRGLTTGRANVNNSFRGNLVSSYITGAHAVKIGWDFGWNNQRDPNFSQDSPLAYRFNNGVPNRITLNATPFTNASNDTEQSLYVQDRWTVGRLTMTAGTRYFYFRSWYPETHIGPGELAPNRDITFPKTDGVEWHNITGSGGAAYDLTGDGKTALQVSLGKYIPETAIRATVIVGLTPAGRLSTSTTRSWNDANRDFVPNCDLLNPASNGECGAMADPNFGGIRQVRAIDPELATGWGKTAKPDYWQFSTGIQREILPRTSVEASYWRTWYGNFTVVDNRAESPEDFDPFSITAPRDPRLPNGGGYVISGLYDIKPDRFGRPASEILTTASKFGKQTEVWNGVDLSLNARPSERFLLQGGVTTQRRSTNNCEVAAKLNNPGQLYCDVTGTFLTQAKFLASYTIPRIDVQVSGNVQNLPGPEISALYTASLAEIQPSLGRPLAGGARNVTVNLIEPRTQYGDRLNMLDMRFGKILTFGRTRAMVSLDLYNALNANTVLTLSNTFATWLQPQSILTARFAKVGLQIEF
jgi:hypothetical protein